MKKAAVLLLVGAISVLFVVSAALGRTFDVPARYKTIQRAIDAASPGDTVLVSPGLYKENLNMRKSVSLISLAGASKTTIDGGKREIVLRCEGVDSTATIKGFTFTNGVGFHGGGVLLSSSFVRVEGNVFMRDSARYGGGLCALWSNSIIKDNKFIENRATYGGAIYSMFIAPTIEANTMENNRADMAGGIFLAKSSEARVMNNSFVGNKARRGGGMFLNGASPMVEGNLFKGNSAEEGGAISSIRSEGMIRENTLWKNSGAWGAAVALLEGEAPDLERNTLVGNFSPADTLCAGLYCSAVYSRIVNNIFADNGPGYAVYCASDAAPVLWCNLMWRSGTGDYFGITTDTKEIRLDPLFCDAEKGNFMLKQGSPALSDSCGVLGAHMTCEESKETE